MFRQVIQVMHLQRQACNLSTKYNWDIPNTNFVLGKVIMVKTRCWCLFHALRRCCWFAAEGRRPQELLELLSPLIRPLSNPCEAFCSHFSNNSLQFSFLGSQHCLTFFPSAKTLSLSLSLSLALSSRNGKCQFPETTASKIRKIFF